MEKGKTADIFASGAPNPNSEKPQYIKDIEIMREAVDRLGGRFIDGSLIGLREIRKLEKRLDSHDKRICKIEEFIKDIPHFFNGDD